MGIESGGVWVGAVGLELYRRAGGALSLTTAEDAAGSPSHPGPISAGHGTAPTCSSVATIRDTDMVAKEAPRQTRGPAPKGSH